MALELRSATASALDGTTTGDESREPVRNATGPAAAGLLPVIGVDPFEFVVDRADHLPCVLVGEPADPAGERAVGAGRGDGQRDAPVLLQPVDRLDRPQDAVAVEGPDPPVPPPPPFGGGFRAT